VARVASPGVPTFGFDLGGTKVLAALVDTDGTVLAEQREPSPETPEEFVHLAGRLVGELTRTGGVASAVGVGAAGLVDHNGTVRFAPNMAGFVEVPLRSMLGDALGLPVVVDNDANVAALGEVRHGAARGARDALVVTLGTGIGGGIILDGHLYRGAHGYAAEIGHITVSTADTVCACGESGHWEAIASGSALGRIGREWAKRGEAPSILAAAGGEVEAITGHHVGDAAVAGAADARKVIDEFAVNVAIGLAALTNVLDPETIVIGGGLVELGDTLLVPVRAAFLERVEAAAHREPVSIVPAALGEQAGVVGAAALAREMNATP